MNLIAIAKRLVLTFISLNSATSALHLACNDVKMIMDFSISFVALLIAVFIAVQDSFVDKS